MDQERKRFKQRQGLAKEADPEPAHPAGLLLLLEILVPSFPTFTEPKIRGECSDSPAPRLPAAQKKPRL